MNSQLLKHVVQENRRRAHEGAPLLSTAGFYGWRHGSWTMEDLQTRLGALVERKAGKYAERNCRFDFLLIVTGEPWLLTTDVQTWHEELGLPRQDQFCNIHLLRDYDPHVGRHPLFVRK